MKPEPPPNKPPDKRGVNKATMDSPQEEFVDDQSAAVAMPGQTSASPRVSPREWVDSAAGDSPRIANLYQASDWFQVFETTERSQSAVMTLEPGGESGDTAESHPHSDQVLLVVEGEVRAEVAGKVTAMKRGDIVTIPAGVKHRFSNRSGTRAVTFSVYAPPAYPPGAKS